jgi:hypothetical protein
MRMTHNNEARWRVITGLRCLDRKVYDTLRGFIDKWGWSTVMTALSEIAYEEHEAEREGKEPRSHF